MDMSNTPDPQSTETDATRIADRQSLFILGKLHFVAAGSHDVKVRNLSATGMMVDGTVIGQIGEMVEIELRNIGRLPAKVVWVAERRMGLALTHPIDPTQATAPKPELANFERFTFQSDARRSGIKTG